MRLVSYEIDGAMSCGIVKGDGVINVPKRIGRDVGLADLLGQPDGIDVARFADDQPDYALEDISFLPVIPSPNKTLCIGLNYRDHATETGAKPPPDHPIIFTRFADAQTGHLSPLVRPTASIEFDYEGELAAIIGRAAHHVSRAHALEYVAGYACFNDGSIRDWQFHSSQFTAGKNFQKSGSIGPWMVTQDEIPDPGALALTTRLNGNIVQEGSTADMLFDLPSLIEYITSFTVLQPGDIIVTGTPAGVGFSRRPPLYMKAGDVVEVAIERIGVLRNPVVDEV